MSLSAANEAPEAAFVQRSKIPAPLGVNSGPDVLSFVSAEDPEIMFFVSAG